MKTQKDKLEAGPGAAAHDILQVQPQLKKNKLF
jgi:hypothetical protein